MGAIILIILGTFLLRWFPRIIRPYALGSDTYYHLLCAESIRQNRMRIPDRVSGMALPGKYTYPYLYHWILAFFPKKTRDAVEPVSSAICDSVLIVIAILFFRLSGLTSGIENVNQVTVSFGLLLMTSPSMLNVSTGPRAYEGTPRTMGEFFFSVYMICIYFYIHSSNEIWLISIFVTGGLVLLSSKFGAQVLFLLSIIMAGLMKNALIMLFPVGAILTALLLSRGKYWFILKNHIRHLHTYATTLMNIHPLVRNRNSSILFKKLFKSIRDRDWRTAGNILINEITFTGLFIKSPQSFVVLYCLITYTFDDIYITYWFIATGIMFLLVSLRPLRFIGEADRYLEYSLIAQYAIIVLTLPSKYLLYILTGQIFLYLIFVAIFVYLNKDNNTKKEEDKRNCWDVLSKYCEKGTVAAITGSRPNEVIYQTGCKVLNTESLKSLSDKEFKYLFKSYPYLSDTDFLEILDKYKCATVLVCKSAITYAESIGMRYPVHKLKKVFENNSYKIYLV